VPKLEIDASVFSESGAALGRVSGKLEFVIVPRAGELVSFLFAPNGLGAASSGAPSLQVKVASVLHTPFNSGATLMLEDVVVASAEEAQKFADFLSAGFDLFYDAWADDAL